MDWLSLFWIFIIIASLQPVVRQKMLSMERLRVLGRLERERNSRAIALIHRQETMSFLGFPLLRYIDINDSEEILRAIKMTDDDVPIDLIVHTPGGLVLAAEQIARALKAHPAKVTVFVPHYAMSGGTLVAFGADEIVMDSNAVLGPVDPQLGQEPAASILKVVAQKPIAEIDDETLIKADIAEKAMRQLKTTVVELLGERMDAERAEKTATTLSSGVFTHDYPITVREARELGLSVNTDMPQLVYQIMSLYPQAAQRRPSVEYIPAPRSRDPERPARRR
ncbi:MAG TPA: ATP-dependent Clp protease proteolytic subunit [Thermoleophilia bacterium]|nr:ATP-dependent Clp protease proteolytic subunit [Thermoleophilia bacterium]HQG02999.1 ATP-dependent Clp protease proteolytic subunit [Thermoleophilia bacterium]HQG54325.1 ATP-dependent Clp protease proteolytic subunit [Thermoleophilia bacterium]